MRLRYLPQARAELQSTAEFYESRRPFLGDRFIDAVESVINRLLVFPHSGRILLDGYRYAAVPGFPYGVIYRVEDEALVIRAVWQAEQDPAGLAQGLSADDE